MLTRIFKVVGGAHFCSQTKTWSRRWSRCYRDYYDIIGASCKDATRFLILVLKGKCVNSAGKLQSLVEPSLLFDASCGEQKTDHGFLLLFADGRATNLNNAVLKVATVF